MTGPDPTPGQPVTTDGPTSDPTPPPADARRALPVGALEPTTDRAGASDFTVHRSIVTPETLRPFVDAGVLRTADVLVAATVTNRAADRDPAVLLGAALAVRAPRLQHVCVDLARIDALLDDRGPDPDQLPDLPALPWPGLDAWRAALAASPLVAVRDPVDVREPDDTDRDAAPLTLAGNRLYLDRLWRDERLVARSLRQRAARISPDVDADRLRADLEALFDGAAPDRQRLAAATAVLRRLTVIAGGPGTGKTTTVARMLALLDDEASAAGRRLPSWALAAPTGKAAARLTESLRAAAGPLAERRGPDDPTVTRLRRAEAGTLHRLLGVTPRSRTRFRHDAAHRLAADIVVIDETSMVSLALIARLLEAVRSDARLVLLGDPEQLASVEAGSVLGDVVGDGDVDDEAVRGNVDETVRIDGDDDAGDLAVDSHAGTERAADAVLVRTVGAEHLHGRRPPHGIDAAIVVLDRVHRFRADSGIAAVAGAIQRGDADATIEALRVARDITWVEPGDRDDDRWLDPVRDDVVAAVVPGVRAARAGDVTTALAGLDEQRILCGPRRGPLGVEDLNETVERWLATATGTALTGRFYPGRRVLITVNDARIGVTNGDVGVVVRGADGRSVVALPGTDDDHPRLFAPSRLPATETVYAMTVHKSQGSQFNHVVVVLPAPGSPLLTRELLYTALTRGQQRATIVAAVDSIRAAVTTRAVRASGLGPALRAGGHDTGGA